jgi:dihydroxyacetone synthase
MSDNEHALLTTVLSNGQLIRIEEVFVLTKTTGHGAMFLYVLNYLTGYEAWTMDELKGYGSSKENGYTTLAHGHPEIECPGVEVTTGPLGQGIANAVGLAIASNNLAAQYNQPGYDIVSSTIYCMTGDGCLGVIIGVRC